MTKTKKIYEVDRTVVFLESAFLSLTSLLLLLIFIFLCIGVTKMDLSCFATKDTADAGKWFQVELYGKKQDFDLLIYGSDSDVVADFTRKQMKKYDIMGTYTGKNKSLDDEDIDELLDSVESFVCRIGGIRTHSNHEEPVTLGNRTLTNDAESYTYLVTQIPALKTFVLEKSGERKSFLPEMKNSSKKQ